MILARASRCPSVSLLLFLFDVILYNAPQAAANLILDGGLATIVFQLIMANSWLTAGHNYFGG